MSGQAEGGVLCELSGGPGCGAVLELVLSAETHLMTFPIANTKCRQVWEYRFANRCGRAGAWVLEAGRFLGYQGFPVPGAAETAGPGEGPDEGEA